MKEKVYRRFVELSNGKWSSNVLKKFSTAKISKILIPSYIKIYEIDTKEISQSIDEYHNLHQFFIRTLKSEARPIAMEKEIFASPVDAKVESFGEIESDMTFTVKEKHYSLLDLLGDQDQAKKYQDGRYIVFYLSPANYHRLHCPMDGVVTRQYILGQKSYPVNRFGLCYGKQPISHNYRMVSEVLYSTSNHYAFIKVGAMFINSIELTNYTNYWVKGEEVGYFSFGSTVVMLFEKDAISFMDNIHQGKHIKVGEGFAFML